MYIYIYDICVYVCVYIYIYHVHLCVYVNANQHESAAAISTGSQQDSLNPLAPRPSLRSKIVHVMLTSRPGDCQVASGAPIPFGTEDLPAVPGSLVLKAQGLRVERQRGILYIRRSWVFSDHTLVFKMSSIYGYRLIAPKWGTRK